MKTRIVLLEKRNCFSMAAVFTAVIIVLSIVCSAWQNSTCIKTTQNTFDKPPKWHTLPKSPNGYDYGWEKYLNAVMKELKMSGPRGYFKDGVIDCKDWTMTFVYYWYDVFNAPDGTCFIVRNVNWSQRFDHCFVGVWARDHWVFIEPQAYDRADWSPKAFWGKKYDPECDCYNETRKFILNSGMDSFYADKLLKRTLVDETYGWQYWDDSHPVQYHTDIW